MKSLFFQPNAASMMMMIMIIIMVTQYWSSQTNLHQKWHLPRSSWMGSSKCLCAHHIARWPGWSDHLGPFSHQPRTRRVQLQHLLEIIHVNYYCIFKEPNGWSACMTISWPFCGFACMPLLCQWGEVVAFVGYLRTNTVQARTPYGRIHDYFLACLIRYASTAIIPQSKFKKKICSSKYFSTL